MRLLLRMFTSLVLTTALLLGQNVRAQDPDPTEDRGVASPVTLRVELVSSLPDDTKAVVDVELAKQLEALGAELGFTVTKARDATLVLQLEYALPNPEKLLYIHRAVVFQNGRLLERADTRTCLRCTPVELVSRSLEVLPGAMTKLLESPLEPVEPPPPTIEPEPAEQPLPPRKPIPGAMTIAGGTLAGLGLAGVVTGAVLLERGVEPIPPRYWDRRNYSKPGGAVFSLSLGSLAVGVVLLLVDSWIVAPRRAARQAWRSGVLLGRNGLLLEGRF